jgi:hypothetical protein
MGTQKKPGKKPVTEKLCKGCGIVKPRAEFYRKLTSIQAKCKVCCNAWKTPEYIRAVNVANREYQNAWRREKWATDPAYRAKVDATRPKYAETHRANRRQRWATDPNCADRKSYRRKDVKDRTPMWADVKAMGRFSAGCPPGHEVDHIHPLRAIDQDGVRSTGLHVPWNLRYLPRSVNRSRKNRI